MAMRSKARDVAIQLLFQHDQNAKAMPRDAIELFARDRLRSNPLSQYALGLFDGVVANRPAIDALISATAENWRLSRMMPADRNILRLGTFELRFASPPGPMQVVIDEAIELAKRFGTLDSPAFVNGILDKIAKTEPEPVPASS